MNTQWLDTKEYPFSAHYFDTGTARMHYIDEGTGETLLFVHGTPSWSFDFRHLVAALRNTHRCVAADHIGFGLSDKPRRYDYSVQNHSATLGKFILYKDLRDITLVLHDFGGPIGFDVALKHPERIKRIVVLNSWLWSSREDEAYRKMSRVLRSPLLPFLYRCFNFSARFLLPASFGEKKISPRILKQYTRPFASRNQREGTLAFARSLLHDQDWFESLWQQKEILRGKPVLLVWGMKDPLIGTQYLGKFQSGFPGAEMVKIASAGHFPQEEEPEHLTGAIRSFMAKYSE